MPRAIIVASQECFVPGLLRLSYSGNIRIFGPNGVLCRHQPPALLESIKRMSGVSSVQITFHEDLPPERHTMPAGGFRLAVIDSFDLTAALAARARLRDYFFSASVSHLKPRAGKLQHSPSARHR
jgi:hypothetical protein